MYIIDMKGEDKIYIIIMKGEDKMFNELNEIHNKLLYKIAEKPEYIYAAALIAEAVQIVAEIEDVVTDKDWNSLIPTTVKTFDASQIINIFKEDVKHENQEDEN